VSASLGGGSEALRGRHGSPRRLPRALVVLAVVVAGFVALGAPGTAGAARPLQDPSAGPAAEASHPPPDDPFVLAHYYIWFDERSWSRAKRDLPALGPYSSSDAVVLTTHVRQAKAAGIDGFIVSWKSTEVLDPRLDELVRIAEAEDFKLAITYQGLDFDRNPQPIERVASDLDRFIDVYADSPAFDLFGKPLIAWSGTWEYDPAELALVTMPRRERLLILATEKNVADYERLAPFVDGNQYYWASVNPATFPDYPAKLVAMGEAVRAHDGWWIAPVAPGFDARMVGGTSEVPRDDGDVLRREWNGAAQSLPDALGIISWNEFSENTHIEPSRQHGSRYLDIVADLAGGTAAGTAIEFDSSDPGGRVSERLGIIARIAMLVAFVAGIVLSGAVAQRARNRRRGRTAQTVL